MKLDLQEARNVTESNLDSNKALDDIAKKRMDAAEVDADLKWKENPLLKGLSKVNRFGLFVADVGGDIASLVTNPIKEAKEDLYEDLVEFERDNPEMGKKLREAKEKGTWEGVKEAYVQYRKFQKERKGAFEWDNKLTGQNVGGVADGVATFAKGFYDWDDPLRGLRGKSEDMSTWQKATRWTKDVSWQPVAGAVDTALILTGVGAFGTAAKAGALKLAVGSGKGIGGAARFIGIAAGSVEGGKAIATTTFTDEQDKAWSKVRQTDISKAMQRGYAFEQGAMQDKSAWKQAVGAMAPGGELMVGDKEAFKQGVKQYFTDKGYSPEEAQILADAAAKRRVGAGVGEAVGIVGANVGSELIGRNLFRTAYGPGASKLVGTSFANRFGAGFVQVGQAGLVEAGAISVAGQLKQERMIDPTELTLTSTAGGIFAGTLGGIMTVGATATGKGGTALAQRGTGKAAQWGTYLTDWGELPGDLMADVLTKAGVAGAADAGVRVPTGVVTAVSAAIQAEATSGQTRANSIAQVQSAIQSQTGTQISPEQAETILNQARSGLLTGTRVSTYTYVPTQTGVYTPVNQYVPAQTQVPTETNVPTDVYSYTYSPVNVPTQTTTTIPTQTTTATATNAQTASNVGTNVDGGGLPANLAGGFPGDARGPGAGGRGVAGWVTANQIADYAGQFQQRAKTFFDEGAGFAKAEQGRQAGLQAAAIPFQAQSAPTGLARPAPVNVAALGVGAGAAGLFARQQLAAGQPLFNRPARQPLPQGPTPYQKAASAVNRGFAGVGQNYGSVVKQPKKATKAVPSGAAAKINQMLGR